MQRIPPDVFWMGSAPGGPGREGDEGPRHQVTLARAFWVSRHEVTEAQWQHCVADKACGPLRKPLGEACPAKGMGYRPRVPPWPWPTT